MGRDTDGGAGDVASLVHEISEMILKYKPISDIPVLHASNPLCKRSSMESHHNINYSGLKELGLYKK